MNPYKLLHVLLALALTGVHIIVARSAAAQWAFEVERVWQSVIPDDAVEQMAKFVPLGDAQENAVREMFERHQVFTREEVGRRHAEVDQLDQKEGALQSNSVAAYEIRVKMEDLVIRASDMIHQADQDFLREVEGVLHESQIADFRRFVQWIRRRYLLSLQHYLPEEGVDLVTIVEEVTDEESGVADAEALQLVVDDYAERLDEQLKLKVKVYREIAREHLETSRKRMRTEGDNVYMGRHPDPNWSFQEQAKRWIESKRRVHEGIHAINRTSRDVIVSALDENAAGRFMDEYRIACYPSAYDPKYSRGLRYLDELAAADGLTEEQLAAVEDIRADYTARAPIYAERIVHAMQEWGAAKLRDEKRERIAELRARYDLAMNDRYDFEQEVVDRLWAILTPEQRLAHPMPPMIRRQKSSPRPE